LIEFIIIPVDKFREWAINSRKTYSGRGKSQVYSSDHEEVEKRRLLR
jgi:hypothetical protein